MDHSEKGLKYMKEGNVQHLLPFVFLMIGMGHYLLGDLEATRNHLQKALKMIEGTGFSLGMSSCYRFLSMVHLDSGEFESAQSCAEKALKLTQENKEKVYEGNSWTIFGRILGKKEPNRINEAEEHILKGIKILEESKIQPYVSTGYLYLGELYTDMGQREKALENLNKAEKMFREMGMDYWLAKTREIMERV